MSDLENYVLFKIESPCSAYDLCFTYFNTIFNMYPNFEVEKKNIHKVFIKDNILFTDITNKIDKFIRNNSSYKLYSNKYDDTKPILDILIYDDEIQVSYKGIYKGIYKNDYMKIFLKKMEYAYENYKEKNY